MGTNLQNIKFSKVCERYTSNDAHLYAQLDFWLIDVE